MVLGAQLFTVRQHATNLDDFAETLKKIADIGYTTIQASGVCAYEPEWLDEQLKANGLRCVITHINPEKIRTETEAVVADHKKFDCKYIGIGMMPYALEEEGSYEKFVENFLQPAKTIAANGGYLMYHNHNNEFMKNKEGKTYFQCLSEDFAPNELGFTVDTYWVQVGGGNPAEWIKKLSGRCPCIHLKDLIPYGRETRMAPVGEGNLDFESILLAAEAAGTDYMLVEQDNCYGEDPFDCLRRSYNNLKAMGCK
ncbi:MAG: sugar phosphate isomerase/epimerase [Clostridia bacterium]|nr:sugar phosphate isomerase/epimerase [Clostridia bacterium]